MALTHEEAREAFIEASKPLIEWLNDFGNPHTIVVVNTTSAELFDGLLGYTTEQFVKD